MQPDPPTENLDRRPISARELKVSDRITQWLVERNITANQISVAGGMFGLASGLLYWLASFELGWRLLLMLAALLAGLRLLANMFDGMVAVATQTTSKAGELFNEVPDRISDSAILIGVGFSLGSSLHLGYLAALFAALTAYIRAVGKVSGSRYEFCGPFAKQQRMFLLIGVSFYMALTPVDWHPTLGEFGPLGFALFVITLGSFWTCIRRLKRIAAYLNRGEA